MLYFTWTHSFVMDSGILPEVGINDFITAFEKQTGAILALGTHEELTMSVETAIIEVIPSFAKPEMGVSKKSYADTIYRWVLAAAAVSVLLIIAGTIYELTMGSRQSIAAFGLHFFTDSTWDPGANHFGALPFILGTLYIRSFWALVLALPVSIFTAESFLSGNGSALWLEKPMSFMVELLAAIPSVVYGLWGLFILQPFLVKNFEGPVSRGPLSMLPIFGDTPNGYDMLSASVILAIMVLPYITAVSRDILQAIPRAVREASYALGATRWETIKGVVLPYARAGNYWRSDARLRTCIRRNDGRNDGHWECAGFSSTQIFSVPATRLPALSQNRTLAEASGLYRLRRAYRNWLMPFPHHAHRECGSEVAHLLYCAGY